MGSELTIVGGRILGETLGTSHQQDIFVVDGVINSLSTRANGHP